MYNIFISYHRDTHNISVKLKKQIESKFPNYNCIIAEDKKRMAVDWAEKVAKHLDECSLVIVLMTETAKSTEWINQELGYAKALHRRNDIQDIIAVVECTINKKTKRIEFIKTKGFITETMDRIELHLTKPEKMIDEICVFLEENPIIKVLDKKNKRILNNANVEIDQNVNSVRQYEMINDFLQSGVGTVLNIQKYSSIEKILDAFDLDISFIEYISTYVRYAESINELIKEWNKVVFGSIDSKRIAKQISRMAEPLRNTLNPLQSILINIEKGNI